MAIIIAVLMAVIILLALAILLIVTRHRQRKCFASPLTAKSVLAENHQHLSAESSCGTYSGKDGTSSSSGMTHPLPKGTPSHLANRLIKVDDYQEPYQALRYAPYYSYSTVVMEMQDTLNKSNGLHMGECTGTLNTTVVSDFVSIRRKVDRVNTLPVVSTLIYTDEHIGGEGEGSRFRLEKAFGPKNL